MARSLLHRPGPVGSIQANFFAVLGAMALVGVAVSLFWCNAKREDLERASVTRDMTTAFKAMIDISRAIGRERPRYLHSSDGDAASADARHTDSDQALESGHRLLFAMNDAGRLARLDTIRSSLASLRATADAALATPQPDAGTPPSMELFSAYDELRNQAMMIAADFEALASPTATALQQNLIDLARLAESLRTRAGTRATLMVTMIAGAPSPPMLESLVSLSELMTADWERIRRLVTIADDSSARLSPEVWGAIHEVNDDYMVELVPLYDRLVESGRHGLPYELTPAELDARSAQAIKSINHLVHLSVRQAVDATEADRLTVFWQTIASLGFPALILTVTGASVLLIRRRVLNPLRTLTRTVLELADGKRDIAVPELGRVDEMGKLAIAIETLRQRALLAEEIERRRQAVEAQLRQAQKMEAMGQLTGGLAHDLNNLLGVIIGNIDLLADEFTPGSEQRESADAVMEAARKGADLNRQLLAFARRQPLAIARVDLAVALAGIGRLLNRTIGENIRLQLKFDKNIWPVAVDLSQLESAIVNLAVNASHAMPQGGRLTIEATNRSAGDIDPVLSSELAPGDYACIAVSDTGTGMSPNVLARVFEPFFTTKETGKGSGLGLSMVHGFVKQSGGHTRITSESGKGTTVRLYLPRTTAPEVPRAAVSAAAIAAPERGNELILVVEDNQAMLGLALRQLKSLGYAALGVANAAEAIEILRGEATIDLLFTDVMMPGGMDGRELAAVAREMRPGLKVLFTSGYTGTAAAATLDDDFENNLLSKPYRMEELARRVRGALDDARKQQGGIA